MERSSSFFNRSMCNLPVNYLGLLRLALSCFIKKSAQSLLVIFAFLNSIPLFSADLIPNSQSPESTTYWYYPSESAVSSPIQQSVTVTWTGSVLNFNAKNPSPTDTTLIVKDSSSFMRNGVPVTIVLDQSLLLIIQIVVARRIYILNQDLICSF
jgi:hypothetical protein